MQRVNAALRRLPVWPVYALGLIPAVWLFWLGLTGGLGPDPVKALEHRYGQTALQLLIATLAVTPLRRLTGLSLLRFRRALGLLAFAWLVLHLTVWAVLDVQLDLAVMWEDVVRRPYITVGMLGFVLLVPLALTSTDAALRRLGAARWRRLHQLGYVAALAGAAHYLMAAKVTEPAAILHLAVILLLLALRLPLPAAVRRAPRGG